MMRFKRRGMKKKKGVKEVRLGLKSRVVEALVPKLISMTLSMGREMVMNALECCRGTVTEWRSNKEREHRHVDMVGRLQRIVDVLTIQLKGERAKNATLEKEIWAQEHRCES